MDYAGLAGALFAAMGTVGALGVSLLLLYQTIQDRRIGQARLISAWMVDLQAEPNPTLTYHVRNNSEEPVYDVVMQASCGVRGTFVRWVGTLGPSEVRELKIVLPGYPRAEEYPPSLGFVDSAGRGWLREGPGSLTKLTDAARSSLLAENAGAYPSIDEHPTMHLSPDGYGLRGKRISDAASVQPRPR